MIQVQLHNTKEFGIIRKRYGSVIIAEVIDANGECIEDGWNCDGSVKYLLRITSNFTMLI